MTQSVTWQLKFAQVVTVMDPPKEWPVPAEPTAVLVDLMASSQALVNENNQHISNG